MRIYQLTPLGDRLSHSTKGTGSPEWKIIYHLKKVHMAEKRQIENFCGLGPGEATSALVSLSNRHIIQEVTGGE